MALSEIRQGLANALRTIDGLEQVSPYVLSSPTPPFADVALASIDYLGAMQRGLVTYAFNVQVGVVSGLNEGAQMALDDFVESNAVPDALEEDVTLGGVCDDVTVRQLESVGRSVIEGTEYHVARWEVEVLV